ncbi:MAG TPA: GspMb/PilO family protein [Thermomonas sp.]|nr:GspMb/PilO family protein [Thermomonas sp.]
MPPGIRKIREEWNSNPRLRWGALIAIVIGFLYLCLVLVEWRRDLHDQYQQRTLQLYKMTALAGQDQWLARAQAAQAVEKALQAEIADAATIGLAQAEVQTFVRQLVNAFGRRLASDAQPPSEVTGQPGLWRIPVTLRGIVGQGPMMEILRRVEESDRLMVIEEFSFTFVQGSPNMSMTLVAYYRVGGPARREARSGAR